MKVKLDYFKASGKWYASGEYETEMPHLFQVQSEVLFLKQRGELPGLEPRLPGEVPTFTILITLESGLQQLMFGSINSEGLEDA